MVSKVNNTYVHKVFHLANAIWAVRRGQRRVRSSLSTGAYCVIDIHNYARVRGDLLSLINLSAHLVSFSGTVASLVKVVRLMLNSLVSGVNSLRSTPPRVR